MVPATYTYDNICFYLYNSRGFGDDKQEICKTDDKEPEVCIYFLQPRKLLNNNKFKLKQCLPEHHIFFKPASMDSLQGRPKMECSLPYHKK